MTAYTQSCESYWSQQEQTVAPACTVPSQSAEDVSKAVSVLTSITSPLSTTNDSACDFAIRGGGHNPWAGAANIDSGATVDLSAIKDVVLSGDKTVVSVGPGATWENVYLLLDAQNLSTSGGRVSGVGVAGLTLGGEFTHSDPPSETSVKKMTFAQGGISFFSPRYGFVCDTVLNHQIVLASGAVVNANTTSLPDLHWALKGGSNNFGIATRFDLPTFEQVKFWGGLIGFPISTKEAQFQAFADLTNAAPYDPYASLILSLAWRPDSGQWVAIDSIEHTQPTAYPGTFEPITNIEPQILNTMRISNITDFTIEINNLSPGDQRQLLATNTFGASAALLSKVFDISNSSLQGVKDTPSLSWALSYEPLPTAITAHAAASRGNALGLDVGDGNLVIALLTVGWVGEENDAAIIAAAKQMFEQADEAAREMGLASGYVYLNYAGQRQDPISGYGKENVEKLRAVSRRYDPEKVFQKRVPGGFKLW